MPPSFLSLTHSPFTLNLFKYILWPPGINPNFKMVVLTTSDNENFTVEREIIERSVLIKNMLEDVGESDSPIPLSNVSSKVLTKVIEWCEHHRNDPPPSTKEDEDDNTKREIGGWDQKFMEVEQEMLFEIILAANYLDIKPLLDLGCKIVAKTFQRPVDEIRKTYNIVSDFTPEEEEQIRRENAWAEQT